MSDVSCRIIDGMLQFMELSAIPLDPVRALLPFTEPDGRVVTEAMLRSPRERVRWSTYVKIFLASGPLTHDAETQRAFVATSFIYGLGWISFAQPALRLLFSPERMFRYIHHAAGSAMFSNVKSTMTNRSDGRLHIVLEIPATDEDLPQFFDITALTLRRVPSIAGWPDAHVEYTRSDRRGEFTITPSLALSLWRRMAVRLKLLFGAGASMREIGQSHETVLGLYHETLLSEAELRRTRAELESRVQERTQALEEAIGRLEREAAERRAAEDRAALFGRLLDQSTHEIYIVCAKSLRFLNANAGALRNLGYTFEELQTLSPTDISVKPSADVIHRVKQVASGSVDQLRYMSMQRRKNGEIYPVDVHLQRFDSDSGTVLVGIVADITDRVRAEAERNQLMNELLVAQRHQTVGALAGGVAHEFNNILTPILAHTTIIGAQLSGNSRATESLSRIEKAVVRGRDVVRQILSLAVTSHVSPQKVRLKDVVSEAVALFRPTLPPNVQLSFEPGDDDAWVGISAAEIHQIVLNLLANAAHALAERGSTLHVHIDANDHAVALSVIDDGAGMDDATRQKIFEPFFTTKAAGGGTGLGLTIVRDIARRHDAELVVESSPGQGSKFSVVFSRLQAGPDVQTSDGSAPTSARNGDGARILLVDDEAEIATVLCEVLRMQGFDAAMATSPEEAIALVARDPSRFALVVTDMSMPAMSGFDLANALRNLAPDLVVCLLTGYTKISAAAARAKGIAAVFEKPIDPVALGTALRDVIAAQQA
jgi:PAS domain S-box-containing protein